LTPPARPPANPVIDRATHVETDVWIVLAAGELELEPSTSDGPRLQRTIGFLRRVSQVF